MTKKKKLTRKEKVETHLFPRVRTDIRAGVVNFGAPNGGEEEVLWSWTEGNPYNNPSYHDDFYIYE